MEFCDQGDLAKRISAAAESEQSFPEPLILSWFYQLVFALVHIHSKSILHRDIKPHNIFLTGRNWVKLGDFGVSRKMSVSTLYVKTSVGTPFILSPEQCEGRPYNQSSDIWGLGLVIYELMALKHAFHAQNIASLVFKICSADPPELPDTYSKPLRDLVMRMLSKNADERPTAIDLAKHELFKHRDIPLPPDCKPPEFCFKTLDLSPSPRRRGGHDSSPRRLGTPSPRPDAAAARAAADPKSELSEWLEHVDSEQEKIFSLIADLDQMSAHGVRAKRRHSPKKSSPVALRPPVAPPARAAAPTPREKARSLSKHEREYRKRIKLARSKGSSVAQNVKQQRRRTKKKSSTRARSQPPARESPPPPRSVEARPPRAESEEENPPSSAKEQHQIQRQNLREFMKHKRLEMQRSANASAPAVQIFTTIPADAELQ